MSTKGGRYRVKFAELEFWENIASDEAKSGNIPVEFQGSVILARPKFPFLSFTVPTLEFVEKYRDAIGVHIEVAHDNAGRVWWSGMSYFSENIPGFVNADQYPYQRILYFDENWRIIANTFESQTEYEVRYDFDEGDDNEGKGFGMKFDVTNNTISIINELDDSVLNFDLTGANSAWNVNQGDDSTQNTMMGSGSLHEIIADTIKRIAMESYSVISETISLGSDGGSAEPAVLGDMLASLLEKIVDDLGNIAAIPTPAGPSGAISASPGYAAFVSGIKAEIPNILSQVVTLD